MNRLIKRQFIVLTAVFVFFLFVSMSNNNVVNYYEPEMVFVEGGAFEMGMAVMGSNPSIHSKGDNYPVDNVSWEDVQEFIAKLNKLTGKNYRLPTEMEWKYASKGGAKSKGYKYSGSNNLHDVAWFEDNSNGSTHPVGSKLPNELGIYDMAGNVREWTSESVYHNFPTVWDSDPKIVFFRLLLGSGWRNGRCGGYSENLLDEPDQKADVYGFRLVLSVENNQFVTVFASANPEGITYL